MSLPATQTPSGFILTVLNGPAKGTTYQLGYGRITLGREKDNVIAINNDTKVSRHHAVLFVGQTGIEVADVSDKNKVIVDDQVIATKTMVRSGSIIQLGETRFRVSSLADAQALMSRSQHVKPSGIGPTPSAMFGGAAAQKSQRRSQRKSGSPTFMILVAIVVLGAAYLFSGSKDRGPASVPTLSIDDSIASTEKSLAEIEAEAKRLGLKSPQYEMANGAYIKGFRDYQKGQFDRAKENFATCLSLMPTHPQCLQYLSLSETRFHELVQSYSMLGRKYLSQNQYAACKSSFRNVMVLMKNQNDPVYREAEANWKLCEAKEGGGY